MTYFFVLYCSLWLNLFDCKSHSRKHIHINMTCICVRVWINSKQQSQSHHTGLYVTCLQSVQCLAAVLPVKRATGGSLACGLHFMNEYKHNPCNYNAGHFWGPPSPTRLSQVQSNENAELTGAFNCIYGEAKCFGSDVGAWRDEGCSEGMKASLALQVENLIQFKHSISFIDPL